MLDFGTGGGRARDGVGAVFGVDAVVRQGGRANRCLAAARRIGGPFARRLRVICSIARDGIS